MEHSDIVPPPRRCRLVAKSLSKVALRLPDYEPVNHCPGTGHERRRIPSSKSGLIACPAARSAKGSQPSFPWIAEQRPVFAPFQWSWNSAFQEVRRATPDSHKGDDVLSIGMSRLSLLTIPRTLYYCLGNTSELRIDPNRSSKAVQGQRPVRVGPSPLIKKFFRTSDSTKHAFKNILRRPLTIMKTVSRILFAFIALATPALATVTVSSPSNGATVGSPVPYVATATTSTCSKGVASMGIYVNNQLVYVVNGASMNTHWTLAPGSYSTVVEEWDYCGGATYTTLAITVSSQSGVYVTSPANNAQVNSPVNYVASSTTSTCSKGVASTGIYVDNKLTYTTQGASLNTQLSLSQGSHSTVVEEWDYCGGAAYST